MAAGERFELTGSGDQWQLAWSMATAPETFTRPLVAAGIELRGAQITIETTGTASMVRFGSTRLRLIRQ